eukprot:359844-Chlamydomonas_euryale.AAC.1
MYCRHSLGSRTNSLGDVHMTSSVVAFRLNKALANTYPWACTRRSRPMVPLSALRTDMSFIRLSRIRNKTGAMNKHLWELKPERRGGVEEELKEVQPLIDQARKAVGNIKKENIDEIRSLKMPPEAIRDVLEGVIMVLGQQ